MGISRSVDGNDTPTKAWHCSKALSPIVSVPSGITMACSPLQPKKASLEIVRSVEGKMT